jgi:SAM-dependent methyltransferase
MTGNPADFYTGLVAEAYAALVSMPSDPAHYAEFVREAGGDALELACGDGIPMLDLVADGLVVEGLDSSGDMLDRCRTIAAQRDLEVTLHHGDMAEFDLGRRFGSVYIAGPSITLLANDDAVARCLDSMARHLEPGGQVLVPFWIPSPPGPDLPKPRYAESPEPHGGQLRLNTLSVDYDAPNRRQTTVLRYERLRHDEVVESVKRPWVVHWLEPEQVTAIAASAGLVDVSTLDLAGAPATADSVLFTLRAGAAT